MGGRRTPCLRRRSDSSWPECERFTISQPPAYPDRPPTHKPSNSGLNILYLNRYAGSQALCMGYRSFFLAREWVRAGHRVQIVAADFLHVRVR